MVSAFFIGGLLALQAAAIVIREVSQTKRPQWPMAIEACQSMRLRLTSAGEDSRVRCMLSSAEDEALCNVINGPQKLINAWPVTHFWILPRQDSLDRASSALFPLSSPLLSAIHIWELDSLENWTFGMVPISELFVHAHQIPFKPLDESSFSLLASRVQRYMEGVKKRFQSSKKKKKPFSLQMIPSAPNRKRKTWTV